MNKKILPWVVLFLLILTGVPFLSSNSVKATSENPSGGSIEGDSVIWENSYGRLEVYPHTSTSLITQTQYADVIWKLGDNNIDLAFRFDILISNSDIWMWQNISHNVKVDDYDDIEDSYTLYNIISFNELAETPDTVDYGDISSSYYYNGTTDNGSYIIGFDSFEWLNPEHTTGLFNYSYYGVTGSHIEQQYWYDWNSKKSMFQYTIHNDKHYYYVSDLPVVQNKQYKFKWQYDTPIHSSGKWELLGKLHSDTIQEALSSGHYIMLDPWWNSNWNFYIPITIDHAFVDTDLSNFPLLVSINDTVGDLCNDGDSIRFLNPDNTTEYYYEIEKWVDGSDRIVWVNITSVSSSVDTVFLLYYGNSDAVDNQDANAVWNTDYMAVWHMDDVSGSVGDSTSNGITLTAYSTPTYHATGKVGYCLAFNGDNEYLDETGTFLDTMPSELTYEMWFYRDDQDRLELLVGKYQENGGDHGNILSFVHNDGGNNAFTAYFQEDDDSTWRTATINDATVSEWFYGTASYKDGGSVIAQMNLVTNETVDWGDAGDGNVQPFTVAALLDGGGAEWLYDGKIDEVRVSNIQRNNSWLNTTFHSQNQTTDFLTFGSHTTEKRPINLLATDYNDTRIILTWTKFYDDTVIVRNTTDPANATDGTEVYNGSLETVTDTGLTPDTRYYYRAYNWNGTNYSIGFDSINQYTTPQPPQSVTSETTVVSGNSMDLNISWVNGTGSDVTMVRRSVSSQPVLVTDGALVYNSSLPYIIDSGILVAYYYTLWSYSNSSGYYSVAVNATDFYVVWVNCYNESDPAAAVTSFGIFFTNSDGTDTYAEDNCNNPHIINVSDIPQGDDIALLVNATGYKDRLYYLDISITGTYFINCYLAPIVAEGETTRLYTIKVIDQYTYPMANVKVTIARYRNETAGYVNISSDYTDGYGEVTFFLVPEAFYSVNLFKSGYTQTGSKYWIPDPDFYGAYYPKTFQMEYDDVDIETRAFWDLITFNGTMFTNGSLHIFYTDSETSTIDAQFHTNEVFNFTITLKATNSTTLDSFDFWVTGLNISRVHKVTIHLNHTILGWVNVTIIINPIHTPEYTKEDIESKAVAVFGIFTPGYANFFLIFIPAIILLLVFGPRHAGMGIIGAGLYMGFSSMFIAVPAPILVLVPFIVAIGFIYIIVKEGGIKL